MLTATYSLVTLLVEQKTARRNLIVLQQQLRNCGKQLQFENREHLQTFLDQFFRFDEFFLERNIDLYVIPAIQRKTREIDTLLTAVETFSATASQIIGSIRDQLDHAGEIKDLFGMLELYCQTLLQRLAKEEELLPMSQRIISNEAWFEMATRFISQDAKFHIQHSDTTRRSARLH